MPKPYWGFDNDRQTPQKSSFSRRGNTVFVAKTNWGGGNIFCLTGILPRSELCSQGVTFVAKTPLGRRQYFLPNGYNLPRSELARRESARTAFQLSAVSFEISTLVCYQAHAQAFAAVVSLCARLLPLWRARALAHSQHPGPDVCPFRMYLLMTSSTM